MDPPTRRSNRLNPNAAIDEATARREIEEDAAVETFSMGMADLATRFGPVTGEIEAIEANIKRTGDISAKIQKRLEAIIPRAATPAGFPGYRPAAGTAVETVPLEIAPDHTSANGSPYAQITIPPIRSRTARDQEQGEAVADAIGTEWTTVAISSPVTPESLTIFINPSSIKAMDQLSHKKHAENTTIGINGGDAKYDGEAGNAREHTPSRAVSGNEVETRQVVCGSRLNIAKPYCSEALAVGRRITRRMPKSTKDMHRRCVKNCNSINAIGS